MPSFEEEAFERARRMSHSRPSATKPPKEPPRPENTERMEKPVAPKPEKPEKAVVQKSERPAPNMIETLFRDKETSLILMLLLLLADEKNDPTLLFTLMYLLM